MDSSPSPSPEDRRQLPSAGESPIRRDNLTEQPLSRKDERIISENPYPDAAVIQHTPSLDSSAGDFNIVAPLNFYAANEQAISYGNYGNSTGSWDGYPQYLNAADGLHISPVVYNDNSSIMFHSGYGFNPEMAYGQYSPVATPLPLMLDGQLYSPQQIPFAPSYYPQSAPPNAPSSVPSSELITSENNTDNLLYGPGSGYLVQFGSYGGGNISGTPGSSPLTSPSVYSHPMGILGPYEHHMQQMAQQPSTGHYQHHGSYHNSNVGSGSISYSGARDWGRASADKGRRRERNHDSVYTSNDALGFDRNRGPRASKIKGKASEQISLPGNGKDDSSSSRIQLDLYNRPDFVTDYENSKFFIIKSFSEDNIHKSIKYSVWASTPHGNKKLDAAYRDAKEKEGNCPVFLLFSVNASGQFCGVAEMVGPVDFERNADYWQQDRWSGQFPVHWHIIKDVPNSRFRHILLENNDNKPVTHSRDSQEVKREQGIEMLKIFKDHVAHTSILEDFDFYNQRERSLKERRAKEQSSRGVDASPSLADETISQISGSFAQGLHLNDESKESAGLDASSSARTNSVAPSVGNSNPMTQQHVNEHNSVI
ncbi:YTH domain-containing protein ECT1-like [Mercurialis annua]|uniref:YTH domain-containing protein ECT1-like n=1 Tax=Mercurialis annua TaxID=3986 RepID=UPI00216078A8|nr:YTH domain-containing protein ECT1-like [Mercurialis annua]